MARYFMIENDRAIELPLLQMMGASTKDGVHTIGIFGTGMKYAICAALRNGIDVRISTEGRVIKFTTRPEVLRGQTIHRVAMQIDNNVPKDRDWTISMGEHEWRDRPDEGLTVEWMILREFLCNAKDEGGWRCEIVNGTPDSPGKTRVFVRMTDAVARIVNSLPLYCLWMSNRQPHCRTDKGDVYRKVCLIGRVYCKGVFIRTVRQNTLYDYDFASLPVTEVRTIDEWGLGRHMGELLNSCPVGILSDLMQRVSDTPDCFEASLDVYRLSLAGDQVRAAFEMAFGASAYVSPKTLSTGVEDALSGISRPRVVLPEGWRRRLQDIGVPDYTQVIAKETVEGIEFVDRAAVDPALVARIEWAYQRALKFFTPFLGGAVPELRFIRYTGEAGSEIVGRTDKEIWVAVRVDRPLDDKTIVAAMIEEFAHYSSKADDCTRKLQSFVIDGVAHWIVRPDCPLFVENAKAY